MKHQLVKKAAYVEIDVNALETTGEINIIGSPIIAPVVTSSVKKGKFEIVFCAELFNVMRELGNRKIEVLAFILDHKDGNNCLNMTNKQLAEAVGVSRPTVIDTIKTLSEAGLLRRKNSVIAISPKLMMQGNKVKEAYLMRKFVEIEEKEIETPNDIIDAHLEGQLSFDMDGEIVEKAVIKE